MTIFRKDLCNLPSLASAYAKKLKCELAEAGEDLSSKLLEEDDAPDIYDGEGEGTVSLIDDYNHMVQALDDFYNYKWWEGETDEFGYDIFKILINRVEAMQHFDLDEIPEFTVEKLTTTHLQNKNNHQTKLMTLVSVVLGRYYGEQFIRSDPDTWPKQRDVVDWLIKEHQLSKREAFSIDLVTRPDEARKK